MTNKKVISIVLGIMCFSLTLGISIQMKTVANSNTIIGSNQKENNLKAEVLKAKEKYENKYRELEKSELELESEIEKATENNSGLEEAEAKIKNAKKIMGTTDVTGPGVIVTLKDGQYNATSTINVSDILVHDLDVLNVINELKNAGAEAVSINGQRIVSTTSIACGGNIITINGEKIGAPFEIKAIGLPEQLAALSRPGGCLEILKEWGVSTELKKSNEVKIPKYSRIIDFKYLKTIQ